MNKENINETNKKSKFKFKKKETNNYFNQYVYI